ncbi:MAG: NAD(P)H-dependent oxidoreductase subunit E [Oscillospiraceae bacterium]|nr:NAD(P)H-dependent oxidoreductase subunit E [Oscillospiraceae bacterium]
MPDVKTFSGTPEQQSKLMEIIEKQKNVRGSLIAVLHEAQQIYGYLPIEVQEMISKGLNVPMTEIYGVVTFYTQFSLEPKGKYNVAICMGTACYVKGAGKILDEFKKELDIDVDGVTDDGKFSIEATRCIGACGLAPVLTVGDDVYGRIDEHNVPAEVAKILKNYKEV